MSFALFVRRVLKAMKTADFLQYAESSLGLSHEPFRMLSVLAGKYNMATK